MDGWWSYFLFCGSMEGLREFKGLEFRLDYKQKRIGYCFYEVSNILYDDLNWKNQNVIVDWQMIDTWSTLATFDLYMSETLYKVVKQEWKLNISIVLVKYFINKNYLI